jgi:hypothetical protein
MARKSRGLDIAKTRGKTQTRNRRRGKDIQNFVVNSLSTVERNEPGPWKKGRSQQKPDDEKLFQKARRKKAVSTTKTKSKDRDLLTRILLAHSSGF